MDNLQYLFDRRNRPAWVVLVISLSLTFVSWYSLHMQAMSSAEQQFELHVRDVIGSIEERLRQHEQILLGGAGLFDASESVDREEWRAYVKRLDLSQNYPGIQGVGFSRIIKPADLQAHIAVLRAEGFADYMVQPPGNRPIYSPIVYLEPFAGRNLAAFGYDMMSETIRAKAMRMAAESGKTAISGKVRLKQETYGKEQAGFLMYVPIYRQHQPLTTPDERWKSLQGFVFSPYRVDDLLSGILGSRKLMLDFVIFDGDAEIDGARMSTSADESSQQAASSRLSALRIIKEYGHTWTVRLYSRPEFEAGFRSPLNSIILVLGGGISVLLFVLAIFLIFRRERAEELARKMTKDIRLNEDKLRQTKYLLDSVIENIPTMVFLKDANDLRFELFNRAGEGLLGYSRSDLLGKSDYDFFPKEQADFFIAADRKVLASDKVLEIQEEPIKTASGEMRYFQTWKIALRDESGEPTHLLGISIDITERKKSAESIARISNLNRAIVDGAEHLIITTDTNGVIQSFNHSAESCLGYQAEELVGKLTPAVFHDPDEVLRRAQELTAAGTPVEPGFEVFVARARLLFGGETHEWTYIRRDGSRFPVLLTVTALRDTHGEINAFLGIATDITERNQAAQERRDDAARIGAILDNVVDGIITINEAGHIELFNKAAVKIFGYSEADVTGKNIKMLMPEPYHSQHDGYLHNYASTGIKKIIGIGRQVIGRRKDGSVFPMDLAVSEMQLGDKRMFIGVVRDITERIKIERMKSEFISTVSHELRTPLTSIRGALALIAGGVVGALPAAAKPMVDIAHKNSERLILLVNDILDMEKIEAGKMEFDIQPVLLMPLLKQALDGNQAYAEQYRVSYELTSELSDAMLKVDKNRLMQVFANLFSNAAKFSTAGGKVSVAVERLGRHIRVSVKDNGAGISDEFKARIFQKFAQADSSDTRKKGGTGLGLSITKAIVEQMGGSIGFDSQPNVQTVFYVEFTEWFDEPVGLAQPIPLRDHEIGKSAPTHPKILHVEDDQDVLHVIRSLVGELANFEQAMNLVEAKQLLAKSRYDLVILDLGLPDGSGKELLPLLKGAVPSIPVLVFSALEVGADVAKNVDGVLVKSRTDNGQLLEVIKQLIGIKSATVDNFNE
ncbi:MAG: PAS domain S-box protein [Gallionella sp.]|nr:PAS domain S-box protein [Gallionella sp.]